MELEPDLVEGAGTDANPDGDGGDNDNDDNDDNAAENLSDVD